MSDYFEHRLADIRSRQPEQEPAIRIAIEEYVSGHYQAAHRYLDLIQRARTSTSHDAP
ncbi:MAG: hypothetical protein ACYDCJ_12310 [Gammaproteobacteria bacterium]